VNQWRIQEFLNGGGGAVEGRGLGAALKLPVGPRLSSSKEAWMTFKCLVFYNQYANFNQTWDKALSYQFFERKTQWPCKEVWLLHVTFLLLPLLFTHKSAGIISGVSHRPLLN
jgi:hypothetical protein